MNTPPQFCLPGLAFRHSLLLSLVLAGLSPLATSGDAAASIAPSRAPLRNRYIKTTAAAVGVVAVLAASVGAWTSIHRLRMVAERKAAIADMERLVDIGRFVDVWRIAQPALRHWPNDPRLQQLQGATTMTVTIAITMATIGRLMKNLDMLQLPSTGAATRVGLTGMLSLTFCTPSTTTRSPGLRPSSIIHIAPVRSPTLTVLRLTLLSFPTTAT